MKRVRLNQDPKKDRTKEEEEPLPSRLLLTVREASRMLNVSREHLYALLSEGVFPCRRLGDRTIRVPFSAVQEFAKLNGQEIAAVRKLQIETHKDLAR